MHQQHVSEAVMLPPPTAGAEAEAVTIGSRAMKGAEAAADASAVAEVESEVVAGASVRGAVGRGKASVESGRGSASSMGARRAGDGERLGKAEIEGGEQNNVMMDLSASENGRKPLHCVGAGLAVREMVSGGGVVCQSTGKEGRREVEGQAVEPSGHAGTEGRGAGSGGSRCNEDEVVGEKDGREEMQGLQRSLGVTGSRGSKDNARQGAREGEGDEAELSDGEMTAEERLWEAMNKRFRWNQFDSGHSMSEHEHASVSVSVAAGGRQSLLADASSRATKESMRTAEARAPRLQAGREGRDASRGAAELACMGAGASASADGVACERNGAADGIAGGGLLAGQRVKRHEAVPEASGDGEVGGMRVDRWELLEGNACGRVRAEDVAFCGQHVERGTEAMAEAEAAAVDGGSGSESGRKEVGAGDDGKRVVGGAQRRGGRSPPEQEEPAAAGYAEAQRPVWLQGAVRVKKGRYVYLPGSKW